MYFIRDTITGKYYVSRGLELGEFKGAVIHTTENSVNTGVKYRCRLYRDHLKISDETAKELSWRKKTRGVARKREKLFQFGMEIVTLIITDEL